MSELAKTASIIEARIAKIATGAKLEEMRAKVIQSVMDNDEVIHVWLLSEIKEIERHRNPTKMNVTLSKLTGTGARTQAIHMFIQTFANVRMTNNVKQEGESESERKRLSEGKDHTVFYVVKKERKALSFFTGRKDGKATYSDPIKYNKATEAGMDEYLKLAAAKPWWEFRPEREARPFDFNKVGETFHNALKRVFDAVAKEGTFEHAPVKLLADIAKALQDNGIKIDDLTEGFANPPEKTPEEISNVVKFKPRVEEEEKAMPSSRRQGGRAGK